MRAIIYENGKRKWSTDDGGHLLGIQKDESFIYPDHGCDCPGSDIVCRRRAILRSREIDLDRNVLELYVESVDGLT